MKGDPAPRALEAAANGQPHGVDQEDRKPRQQRRHEQAGNDRMAPHAIKLPDEN